MSMGDNTEAYSVVGFVELENVNQNDAFENFNNATREFLGAKFEK